MKNLHQTSEYIFANNQSCNERYKSKIKNSKHDIEIPNKSKIIPIIKSDITEKYSSTKIFLLLAPPSPPNHHFLKYS